MVKTLVQLATMPDIKEYVTIDEAAADDRVPYTDYWLRRLCQDEKIKAMKVGSSNKGTWLIHMPSLLSYIEDMENLGTKKHSQNK